MKAIITKYLPPTNTKGGRIRASDMDGNSIIIPFRSFCTTEQAHRKAAECLCNKMNWHGTLVQGSIKNGQVFVFAGTLPAVFQV